MNRPILSIEEKGIDSRTLCDMIRWRETRKEMRNEYNS